MGLRENGSWKQYVGKFYRGLATKEITNNNNNKNEMVVAGWSKRDQKKGFTLYQLICKNNSREKVPVEREKVLHEEGRLAVMSFRIWEGRQRYCAQRRGRLW